MCQCMFNICANKINNQFKYIIYFSMYKMMLIEIEKFIIVKIGMCKTQDHKWGRDMVSFHTPFYASCKDLYFVIDLFHDNPH